MSTLVGGMFFKLVLVMFLYRELSPGDGWDLEYSYLLPDTRLPLIVHLVVLLARAYSRSGMVLTRQTYTVETIMGTASQLKGVACP